jgi:flagellar motor switch protein FliM
MTGHETYNEDAIDNEALQETDIYDFRNARRLSKDQRVGLHTVNESFAKLLSAYFSTLFRALADVRVSKVDEITYGEFISSRPEPDCIWTFHMDIIPASGLIEIDPVFTFSIVDRLFGGNGEASYSGKAATKIEQNLIRRVIDRILDFWDQSWLNLIRVTSSVRGFESKPYLVQIAARNEPILQLSFDVQISAESFQINICFPLPMIEPLISSMKDQTWSFMLPKAKNAQDQNEVQHVILKTETSLIVVLGKTRLNIRDFMALSKGDVLVLMQNTKDPLKVNVGNRTKFLGLPGIVDNQRVIKISEVRKERE